MLRFFVKIDNLANKAIKTRIIAILINAIVFLTPKPLLGLKSSSFLGDGLKDSCGLLLDWESGGIGWSFLSIVRIGAEKFFSMFRPQYGQNLIPSLIFLW